MNPAIGSNPSPRESLISNARTWIEIAYLDSGTDYREVLCTPGAVTSPRRAIEAQWHYVFAAALVAIAAVVVAAWVLL